MKLYRIIEDMQNFANIASSHRHNVHAFLKLMQTNTDYPVPITQFRVHMKQTNALLLF